MPRLPPSANTHVNQAGLIFGDDFDDSYFSRDNGLEETRTVFLGGCGLPEAWSGRQSFVIGELGFGTGLNILATWDLWKKNRPLGGVLHIVTVEGFLLDASVAQASHQMWPELAQLSDQLIAKWPTRSYGAQRIWFPDDGLCITFLIGPCEDVLARMDFCADCWFLDGFSPARNPDMWSSGVFAQVARLSAPGARLATYSVAGHVRAGLAEVGFDVTRAPGFGTKRQRLEAVFGGTPPAPKHRPQTAIVVGGGIAGAAAAAAFARRGIKVDLFDPDPCAATKASGNPVALIMPRLDRGDTYEARFFRASYLSSLEALSQMGDAFSPIGVNEVGPEDAARQRLANLAADPPLPLTHLAKGVDESLFHVQGGLAFPDLVLKHLTRNATCHPRAIETLLLIDAQWCALNDVGEVLARADICVIASGPAAARFSRLDLDMRGRAGQLSWAKLVGQPPRAALTGGAYAAPFHNKLMFGATFDYCDLDGPPPPVSEASHRRNLDNLALIAPDLARDIDLKFASGRSAIRATTGDQLPIAGALEGEGAGKFILTGLGTRGFTTAYLCAEIIASLACHEPSPVEANIAAALAPDRFEKRAAKRRK
jgi:tRNA 5-methylaminomethyl-2-thiouridine biosynthesis bifunctional protein